MNEQIRPANQPRSSLWQSVAGAIAPREIRMTMMNAMMNGMRRRGAATTEDR